MISKILKKISSVTNKSNLAYSDLVKESLKARFPVYSLFIIIKARFERINKNAKQQSNSLDGWVNLSMEAEIENLQAEISRLRKIKLIDFPNIDKKWMRLFTFTAIGAGIIVIMLFIRGQHYVNKSEQYGYNIEILQDDTTALADVIRTYECKIDELNKLLYLTQDSVVKYKEKMLEFKQLISNKDSRLKLLEDQKKNLTSELSSRDNIINGLKDNNNRLSGENRQLREDKIQLIKKMQQLDKIKFSLGYSAKKINDCRTRFTEKELLYFNVYYPLKIHRITVEARRSSQFEFTVYDCNTGQSQRKIIYLPKGTHSVDLNFELTVGDNHYLTFSGGSLIALQECFSFPFGIDNLIRFTKGSSSVYPPFYDLVVSANVQFM
jgi:hypothetical protein